jgi:hypothetical protein
MAVLVLQDLDVQKAGELVLLQQVFPNRYGIPDAVCLRLEMEALDKTAAAYLAECPASGAAGLKSLLLRLLAGWSAVGVIRASCL